MNVIVEVDDDGKIQLPKQLLKQLSFFPNDKLLLKLFDLGDGWYFEITSAKHEVADIL